jgi:hypothetical protein
MKVRVGFKRSVQPVSVYIIMMRDAPHGSSPVDGLYTVKRLAGQRETVTHDSKLAPRRATAIIPARAAS